MTSLPASTRTSPYWGVLAICAIAQFMVVLDVSIVNVALPQMRHDLGLTITSQQWVVNAYTLTFAGFLMLGGRAADLFGRRQVFLAGLSLFTAASLVGGLAQAGAWLIAARAAQGLGGAVLAPTSLSLLTSTFTDMAERRRAMGVWSATAASGAAAGVLAGGILTDLLDWRWVLFVNVPIGLSLLVTAPRVLPESQAPGPRTRLDVLGAFTITAGLALFVYGIVSTDTHSWSSAQTITALAGGAAFLLTALFIEARVAPSPLVPLSIFRRRLIVRGERDRHDHRRCAVRHVLLHLSLSAGGCGIQPAANGPSHPASRDDDAGRLAHGLPAGGEDRREEAADARSGPVRGGPAVDVVAVFR